MDPMDPETFRGMVGWMLFGFGIGVTGLLVASLFPKAIPSRVQSVNL